MTELEMKKAQTLEDGKHRGKIMRIQYRDTPFEYTDLVIKPEDYDIELRYGVPTNLSENSKLGKLVKKFTALEPGQKIDIEKVLVGHEIQFLTVTEITERGEFARVVDGSISPITE